MHILHSVQNLHSDFRYFRQPGRPRVFSHRATTSCAFPSPLTLHPGKKDPRRILFRSTCQKTSFRFMVYFRKPEIQRVPLSGFFQWQPDAGVAKITPYRNQIALREKQTGGRGISRQNSRSVIFLSVRVNESADCASCSPRTYG